MNEDVAAGTQETPAEPKEDTGLPAAVAVEEDGEKKTLGEALRELSAESLAVIVSRMPKLPGDGEILAAYEARMKSRDRAKLALVMIVRDADKELLGVDAHGNLSVGMLSRVAGEVWDTVVVDTGSKDKTPSLATELGARVYSYSWNQDFAAARNFAISKVRPGARFILHLDADEVLSREFVARLNAMLEDAPDNRCYAVPLEIQNTDGPLEGGITMQVRVFPVMWGEDGLPRVRFEGAIHEQIRYSLEELGCEEEIASNIRIVHTGYADPDRTKLKCVRNREILERELDNPCRRRPKYEILWHLSKCEAALGHTRKALDLVIAVAMDPDARSKSKWLGKSAFRWWGELLSREGSPLLAIRVWEEAEGLYPDDPMFPALIGFHLKALGARDEAIAKLLGAAGRDYPVSALDVPVQEIRARIANDLVQLLREKAYGTKGLSRAEKIKLLTEANKWETERDTAFSSTTVVRPG